MRPTLHPLCRYLISQAGLGFTAGMAWLDAEGYFDPLGDSAEVRKVRDIPMALVEDILMALDAAWCLPDDAAQRGPEDWIYLDEDLYASWRETLPEDDPRRDPDTLRDWRKQQNQHYTSDEPDDYHHRERYSRLNPAAQNPG